MRKFKDMTRAFLGLCMDYGWLGLFLFVTTLFGMSATCMLAFRLLDLIFKLAKAHT